ncbi:carboxypeptidase-like regulatory domain-containing protein [Tautonia rosea]|uniref:carboxypeptidase-like regulatory domain-containing protein n=1 Tax=Tautonia rosea TaxID=2728037 RepID=UPI001472D062|nr:carboxypeptidase-like regulatory domain-containing protein [Tautonia rosea]
MTRFLRPLTFGGLIALLVSLGPMTAQASGLGLFGPRETTYITPIETVSVVPTVSSYVIPTTSVVSTSYLVPTTSVVYRPARYTLAPTIYRPASTTVLPTSYLVGSSFLQPTRYYTSDVVATSFVPTSVLSATRFVSPSSVVYPSSFVYPSSIVYPSSVVYDAPIIDSGAPIYVDRPSAPAVTSGPQGQSEPGLSIEQNRQRGNPPGVGRAPALENQPIDPRPEPEPTPSEPARTIEPEPLSPPDLPAPSDDGSIEGIGPLPSLPFEEFRESRRPAFSGNVPGSTLAAATRLVQGRVRDEDTGRPVAGAVVRFSNTIATFAERQAVTNDRGEFQLAEFLPDGDWSIVVSGTNGEAPTRTYPLITVMSGRIYDRLGRDYSKLVLDY